jgi:hypothetical protein
MKELKENEVINLKGRLYKVCFAEWNNGRDKGKRAFLKLLTKNEMMTYILRDLKKEENQNGEN